MDVTDESELTEDHENMEKQINQQPTEDSDKTEEQRED